MTGGPTHSGKDDLRCLGRAGTWSGMYQDCGRREPPCTPSCSTISPVVGKTTSEVEDPLPFALELYWMWNAVLAWEFLLSRFVRMAEIVPPAGPMDIWREEREPCRWSREEVE